MILIARLLARLLGIALLGLLALTALAAAVFCIQGGHGTLSLAGLAGDIHLPQLRAATGRFLAQLTATGPAAVIAALCGAGASGLGVVLILGAWIRPRPRRIVLAHDVEGSLGTLPRALSRTLASRLALHEEVERVRVRARPRRHADGGRIHVIARPSVRTERSRLRAVAQAETEHWLDGLPLELRVTARRPSRRARRDLAVSHRAQEATP